jgi:hypothetical protein
MHPLYPPGCRGGASRDPQPRYTSRAMSHLPRRRRVRLVWLTLIALLLQQVALAAHACDMRVALPQEAVATSHLCDRDAAAVTALAAAEEHAIDALCLKHCSPDRAAQADQAGAKLAMLLPPVALPVVAMRQPPATMHPQPTLPGDTPPPTLRFCTLLI